MVITLTFNIPTANQYVRNLQILQFIVKNTSVIRLFFQKCFPPTRFRMIRFSFRGLSTIWLHFITQKIGQWSDVFFKLCMTPTSSTFQRKWSIVGTWVLSSWSLYTWVKSASNKFIPLTKLFSSIKIFTEVTCLISDEVCIYVTRKLTNSFFSLMLFITVKTSRRSWSSNLMVLGSEGKYELIISSFELFREIVTACSLQWPGDTFWQHSLIAFDILTKERFN